MKICSKCQVSKEASLAFYHSDKNNKDKLCSICKECRAKSKKKYYEANKYKIREYKREYYKNNVEKLAERDRKYYLANKESVKERNTNYAVVNRWVGTIRDQRRRANKRQLTSTLTGKQWDRIKVDFNNRCAYCGMSEQEHMAKWREQLHQEHFIALSNEGEYTVNNIIPSCRSCNSSKGNKDFSEWYKQYEHYDSKREQFILKYLNYTTEDTQQLALFL